jgi:hypothetical protein
MFAWAVPALLRVKRSTPTSKSFAEVCSKCEIATEYVFPVLCLLCDSNVNTCGSAFKNFTKAWSKNRSGYWPCVSCPFFRAKINPRPCTFGRFGEERFNNLWRGSMCFLSYLFFEIAHQCFFIWSLRNWYSRRISQRQAMCFLSALFLDTEYQYFCIQSFRKPLLPAGYQMISRYVTKIEGEAICAKVATASNLRIKHPFKQPLSERGVSQGCAANSFSLSKSTDVSSKLVQKARDPKSIDSSVVRKDLKSFPWVS